MDVPAPRCLGCGQRTTIAHPDCAPISGAWEPCPTCCGLRHDAAGRECRLCDGVGFLPLGSCPRTLAEIAGETTNEVVYYVTDPNASRRQSALLIDDCAELW